MKTLIHTQHGKPAHILVYLAPGAAALTMCGRRLGQWRIANKSATLCRQCRRAEKNDKPF